MRTRTSSRAHIWTARELRDLVRRYCGTSDVVVLANREPWKHDRDGTGGIAISRSASGLVTAIEPVLEACHGIWIAHGSGSADRDVVDCRDSVLVPPDNSTYRLRRVWLDQAEERGYYYGFANEALWPLCHDVGVHPIFRANDFATYARVNAKFAAAVCDEVTTERPVVLVQDYHFALAPRWIAQRRPAATTITFWHIPWPAASEFASCPWAATILHGLLGSRRIGFHTDGDCDRFFDAVEALLHADVDRSCATIVYQGRQTCVAAHPISIEWPSRVGRQTPPIETCRAEVYRSLGLDSDIRLLVGIDRFDYTKGIYEKVLAVERLLERHAEFRGRVTLAQVAEPSRECLPAYAELRARVRTAVDRVNQRFGDRTYRPVILCEAHHEPRAVYTLLRAADACYVGSLRDGMNLVAKEFAAARYDEQGVLVLSAFTGASQQLTSALLMNPYDVDAAANTLVRALQMTPDEQRTRMRTMRRIVAEHNSYRWIASMLEETLGVPPLRDVALTRPDRRVSA